MARIPLEDFFKEPRNTSFRLSPDGKKYAYLAPIDAHSALFIVDIATNTTSTVQHAENAPIHAYLWADVDALVYETVDTRGIQALFSIDCDSGRRRRLVPPQHGACRLANDVGHTDDQLMIYTKTDNQSVWHLQRLQLSQATLEPLSPDPDNIVHRVTDHKGRYRLALQEQGVETHILFRHHEGDAFHRVFSFDNVRDTFRPVCFDRNDTHLYAYSNIHRDKVALVEYDLNSNREVRIIYEVSDYDLFGDDETDCVAFSKHRGNLAYVLFTTWRRTYHFFDDYYRRMISFLENRFPGYVIRIVHSDRHEKMHIVKITSDRLRGKYYLFNSTDESCILIEDSYPWLEEKDLAVKKPIHYESRDGMTIHGYLTLPRGVEPQRLPLIVYPHGGPRWRDCWEMGRFTELQFLASRGYAVLNVNFRGSSGYGKRFMTAGFKQNGRNVQNDITDGIEYLVDERIVDKKRVAIMGGSYGGYVVLAGLAFTPETYACGVDMFGVSNFFSFLDALPPWFNREILYETIGHPVRDRELLERTSPALHTERIMAPLLIAQGGRDPVVNRSESDQVVEALRQRGIEIEYILQEDEGHGYFADEGNRIELWSAIEVFLEKHLGPENIGHGRE